MLNPGTPGIAKDVSHPNDKDSPTIFKIEGLTASIFLEIMEPLMTKQGDRVVVGKVPFSAMMEIVRFGVLEIKNFPANVEQITVFKYGRRYKILNQDTIDSIASMPEILDWLSGEILGLTSVTTDEKKVFASPSPSEEPSTKTVPVTKD